MLWGYDADHPFEGEAGALARSGLAFFVCPGTSSWQSFGGRTGNMLANTAAAAAARLAAALDAHVFRDPAQCTGAGALALGRVEEALASGAHNGTAPFFLLAF